ncbi:SusC/RagA family TonB-linked outer membrane protein [Abyssalbus ytuae]|uniref:SusC/RagA family TonB-linked outer membrane protein n=1 Tax=Abyssalbus ytuae TaxID=2926907 RepID=A0A9E7D2L7_9FLAO|nr:SusC/RagA family TonB-linked outer membrane protein [Abyssalbus ytuae]UOB18278.1 SusC/RagA family TonB-linked outer membrane protein [Abyssalbus ytuae]
MIKKKLHLLFILCFFYFSYTSAQSVTITGTITDTDNIPLAGVNIIVKGTSIGTSSDFDGGYSIDVDGEAPVLQFSYLGFKSLEIPVNGRTAINVVLEENYEALDEVVVTSLGISREKKSLGYSVTQVDGSSVSLVKEPNVASSLAGKVAGVVVTRSTSGPAGGTRIVIRGNNSLKGENQPLYVIDGVPIDNSGLTTIESLNEIRSGEVAANEYSVGDFGSGISDINPDDIESISVLKGPNAAALYGSRASNGAIVITTKKGSLGKGLGISYTTSTTFEKPLVLPEYQNQYGRGTDGNFPDIQPDTDNTLVNEVAAVTREYSWGPEFDGSQQLEFNGELRPYSAQPNNVKDFFNTGTSFVNTLAISGGTEKSSLFFSYTNSDIGSILPNSSVTRNNFNLRGQMQLSDKLSFDAKVTYFLQDAKNRPEQGTEGIAAYLLTIPRNVNINDLRQYQNVDNPIDPNNPYNVIAAINGAGNPHWMVYNDSNKDKRKRIYGYAKMDYKFTDWLSAFVRVGTDAINHNTEDITATGHHFYPGGLIVFNKTERTETNYDFLVMFNKDISEKFNLSANAGANARHSSVSTSKITGEDFRIPGRYFLDNTDGEKIVAQQSGEIEKKVHSVYGQASLSYEDMIYLEVTGRNDWSSALSSENRSYFYSSGSLSLLLDQIFDLNNTKINLAKIRISIANVGNDTDPQQIVNLFKIIPNSFNNVTQIDRPNIKFSESLKPEDVTSTDFGFEFRAFNNRFFADFSYYNITSTDLIFDVPVDPGTGYDYFRTNVGKITNKGFEVLIGGTPVQSENFKWDTSINISKNKNKLESLIEGQDNFTFSSSNGGIVDVRAQVGGGFGDIYTTTWLRNDAGQLILTSEGRPQATSERVKQGNYQPDAVGGFTNTFSYKNFTLNTLIDFRLGGDVYSFTDASLDDTGVSKRSLQFRESGVVVEGVVDDGTGNFIPNTTTISAQDYWGAVSNIGSEYVYDQTNVRLREVSLTYRFPKKLLDKTFITNAAVSLTGRNLFFLYKKVDNFDPESSYSTSNFRQGVLFYSLPTTRSLGLSLNVNF